MDFFYENASEAMEAPFEPKNPCRQFETRACENLSMDDSTRFRMDPCPVGECVRFPNRDARRL